MLVDLPIEIIIYICTFTQNFAQLRSVSQHLNTIIQINKDYIDNVILMNYLHSFEYTNWDFIFEYAVQNNYIAIVELLLTSNLHPDCVKNSMYIAAQHNCIEIIVLLIKNINISIDIYESSLCVACLHNATKIIKLLCKQSKLINYTWPFVNAVIMYNVETIHLLLDYVCDNNCSFAMDNIALIKSSNIHREIETYKLLLPRTHTDIINKTFHNVVQCNNKPIVQLLIPYIDLDALEYQDILLYAIKNNNKSLVAILLTNIHAHVSINNNINLITAGLKNYKTIIQLLLTHPNINVNIPNFFIFTHAVACIYPILVELLLADGRADPCANNNEALRNTCILQNREIGLLLIADPRIDITATNIFEKDKNYYIITHKKIVI